MDLKQSLLEQQKDYMGKLNVIVNIVDEVIKLSREFDNNNFKYQRESILNLIIEKYSYYIKG